MKQSRSISLIYATAIGIILSASLPTRAAETAPRMITTNSIESAPLNSVNRAFSRVQALLDDSVDSDRLSYHLSGLKKNDREAVTSALKHLLVTITDDQDEAEVKELSQIEHSSKNLASDRSVENELGTFDKISALVLNRIAARDGDGLDLTEDFVTAVKSALVRDDIDFYVGRLSDKNEESHLLIFHDQETGDVLIVDLANASIVSE